MKATKKSKTLRRKKTAKISGPKPEAPKLRVGMEFPDQESMLKGIEALNRQGEKYDLAGFHIVVATSDVARKLQSRGFTFKTLRVVHMLDLPLEKQKQIRGGLGTEEVIRRMQQAVESRFDTSRLPTPTTKV